MNDAGTSRPPVDNVEVQPSVESAMDKTKPESTSTGINESTGVKSITEPAMVENSLDKPDASITFSSAPADTETKTTINSPEFEFYT